MGESEGRFVGGGGCSLLACIRGSVDLPSESAAAAGGLSGEGKPSPEAAVREPARGTGSTAAPAGRDTRAGDPQGSR